uniref:ATP-dependent Clp protease proteolytic subunit n=2 Tax=Taiwania TaxID=25613 RepID=A0A6M3TVA9_9CONI|nr:ATP-dependent Clp protease proteolytic subunit [Taiwania cryptomerioides]QJE37020.1 ATP-dependent Clp protease proteolytic subunit [Taiwania flousiana]BAK86876.1 ATP-dependent Clp protease proteolytic subunit [Taiwania cryptomerioides]
MEKVDSNPIPKVPLGFNEGKVRWSELYHKLFHVRILFLCKPLDKKTADLIVKSLMFLHQEDKTKDYILFLNCRGGGMTEGVSIYDTMQYLDGDVTTLGYGMNASMGAFVLYGGTITKRLVSDNARVMLHQPHMSASECRTAEESAFDAEYMNDLRTYVLNAYLSGTQEDYEMIHFLLERDVFLLPEVAVDLGIIDEVGIDLDILRYHNKDPDDLVSVKKDDFFFA